MTTYEKIMDHAGDWAFDLKNHPEWTIFGDVSQFLIKFSIILEETPLEVYFPDDTLDTKVVFDTIMKERGEEIALMPRVF